MAVMSVAKMRVDDHEGPWTVDDVLALPEHPARARYELVDGVLMMSPAPAWDHQIVSSDCTVRSTPPWPNLPRRSYPLAR
ncbi:hypothetical protein SAZ11_15775 [Streptomyces sp. FXJ1.4098]|uniref:hypothetical protein n=1 Tax=Streptomyces sp. NPDC020845 TaxID=3365096 RepID=UPI00299B779A|nr:hypothetical protein [Streptomyces sp. FXJ1.4098]